jgi:uncharacterized protein YecE (DUF72 family)
VLVGTSGWQYAHWRERLYPAGLAQSRWLAFYAERFDTVEVNGTFYRLPSAEAAAGWAERTPPRFVFACKGSRFLTHMKRLLDHDEGLARFFAPLAPLGRKLAVVLWQLPPQMTRADPERLDRFLAALPAHAPGVRHAVEFRSAGWYEREVCDVLDAHGAAFCEHDLVPLSPPRLTGGFRYLRWHGATGKYRGRYGARWAADVAGELRRWKRRGRDAFVYFNNDVEGHAVADARDLAAALAPRPSHGEHARP